MLEASGAVVNISIIFKEKSMSTNVFSGPNAIKKIPSQAYLKSLFDCRDGVLYWKVKRNGVNAGGRAGYVRKDSYTNIVLDGEQWKAHRLVYQWHHGDLEQSDVIDHWDGNKSNNNISNLRPCDNKSNCRRKKKVMSNNTSGLPGVSWRKDIAKWQSYHQDDTTGKRKHIGQYTNKYQAYHLAREAMVIAYGVDYKEPVLTLENRQAYMDWLLDSQPDPAYDWMTA